MNELLSLDNLTKMSNSDLALVSSQITGRLNNEDWQQLVYDLRSSGHIHTFMESAPLLLQRFIRLEIDLDSELSRRSSTAPLLSTVELYPQRPRPEDRQLLATVASQDNAAMMAVDINPMLDMTDISFTVRSMLTLRFRQTKLEQEERRNFLNLMRRDLGMAFLWTKERWEQDYLLFIRQEYFTRVYAFSRTHDATARMTTEATGVLVDWLEKCWFPRIRKPRSTQAVTAVSPESLTSGETKPDTLLRIVKKLETGQLQKPPILEDKPGNSAPPATPAEGEANPFTW